MRRTGRYDTFDKWEILRRSWEDGAAITDLGHDQWGRNLLDKWRRAASAGGRRGCVEYIQEKLRRSAAMPQKASPAPSDDSAAIGAEIERAVAEIGAGALQSAVRDFASSISDSGVAGEFRGQLSGRLAARLHEVFQRSALDALRWTEDDGEIPTLDIVRAHAGPFPVGAIRRRSNALCLFSCRFYGRSDVIRVHDGCIDDVTLVDNDPAGLDGMKAIYPAHWRYIVSDYTQFLASAAQLGSSYELVVADQWMNMCREVAWQHLADIMRICTGILITNYTRDMFEELGIQPDDLAALSRAVSDKTGEPVEFIEAMPRNPPVYWVVLQSGLPQGRPQADR
jgi:transposase-like protein